ncbi:MAG: mannose-1-phosphate guanylyltransferase [Candidatus Zixiibacteriota bacterium]
MIYGIVLAGGRGERFWPLSRSNRPKQFLKLTSDKTMLEETIERVLPLIPMERIRIVTGDEMHDNIVRFFDSVTKKNIISEPQGRNTCLAIGLAAVHVQKEDPEAVMVVLSADHLIRPAEKLLDILRSGAAIASVEDRLITIGITPTRPDTNYGYIQLGEMYKHEAGNVVYNIRAFKEKPKADLANEYYYSRQYLWNSGMFVWSAASILKAIEKCQPELAGLLSAYAGKIGTSEETQARQELYEQALSISIDYAVLEKADNVLTIKADIVWDDIGGWRALERYKDVDRDNNVIVGQAVPVETYECTIFNAGDGLVATFGVSDLVIVRADNITFVAHRTRVADVKDVLARLKEHEDTEDYL